MDGTQDVYVNNSASSSLAFNLSFTILTIFSLIHSKSRCDQKEKKLQQSTLQFTGQFYNNLALNPGILNVIGSGILGSQCHAMKNKNANHSIQKD